MSTYTQNTFTKHNLGLIESSAKNNYVVKVHQTQDGQWTINIIIGEQKNDLSINTARGKLKKWRNMQDALLFVQKNCKTPKSVFIDMGNWKFCRIDNPKKRS